MHKNQTISINRAGNKLIQYPQGKFYVLNEQNEVIDEGSHLAVLWESAHRNGQRLASLRIPEIAAIAQRLRNARVKRKQRKAPPVSRSAHQAIIRTMTTARTVTASPAELDRFARQLGATENYQVRLRDPELRLVYVAKSDVPDTPGIALKVSNF